MSQLSTFFLLPRPLIKYADRKGFPIALIGGPDELEKGVWQVKDMREGSSDDVADGDLVSYLQAKL